ncbi:MFS transporter [Halobacteria archaeon AArc-curdl1]|uniref:MFS transporter n=1 Tax=Natronosalvus hydrolyticus TaxID=2979988 RepID=A0AAP3E7G8_9EURY|nr:MFS transporter [Halobacteria archaeon AArc-curdl1]
MSNPHRRLGNYIRDPKTVTLVGHTNFRRLYAGHAVSRIGDELYFVAAMWLVYALTGSTVFTGLAAFLSRFPQAIGFLLGPIIDRAPLGRLIVTAEGLQGTVVLLVPVAAVFGVLNVWVVLAIMPMLGILERCSGPAQNAAIPRVIDETLLVRANSLISTGDRAIGALAQALAGALIAVIGAVALYAVNAATFVASAVLFSLLAIPSTEKSGSVPSARAYLEDVAEGIDIVRRSVVGHMVVGAALAAGFLGMAVAVLPAFADGIGGAATYGLLMAAMTVGSLIGALGASTLENVPFGWVTVGGFAFAATCWLGAALAGSLPVVLVLFGLAFVPVGSYNVLVSASVQTGVPEELLGRVTATAGSVTGVVGPLGLLVGGILGDFLGSGAVIAAAAVGFSLIAVYWLVVPELRTLSPVESIGKGSFAPAAAQD